MSFVREIEWLLKSVLHYMLKRDLFQQRGLHQEIVAIRESLDTSLSGQLRIL